MTTFRETLALAELGRERVLSVEDWVKVRRLRRAEGMPIAEIARVMGISWNTVKAALASGHPSRYVRRPQGSVADAFEPRIRELLRAYPSMPSTVIAERIGWPYSVRTLSGEGGALAPGVPAAVPRVVDRVCGRGDRAVLTAECQGFCGTLGARVIICRAAGPKPRAWWNGCMTTWSGRSCRSRR